VATPCGLIKLLIHAPSKSFVPSLHATKRKSIAASRKRRAPFGGLALAPTTSKKRKWTGRMLSGRPYEFRILIKIILSSYDKTLCRATDTTKLGVLEEVSRFENVRYGPARFVNTRSTPQAQLVFLSPTLAKVSVCISFRGQHPSWTETDAEKIERQKQSSAYSRKLEATLLRQSAVCGSTCCLDYEAMKKP